MNINEIPKPDFEGSSASDAFFDKQHRSILAKTLDLENWMLTGSKNVEQFFPVPDGYWLEMEDGIRARVLSPDRFNQKQVVSSAYQWVTACLATVMVAFATYFFWPTGPKSENWTAQLEQISDDDVVAYMASKETQERETAEILAVQYLDIKDLPSHAANLNDNEIESEIENLNNNDLLQELSIN